MPHLRSRHIEPLLLKSLKFWPVLCLVGSRQVGKSTLLKSMKQFSYITLDEAGSEALAKQNPAQLLNPPCTIDEAQRAPSIFNAVKLNVDLEKRPGKFILTGSIRFSKRTLIRESLTGRAKTIQMFPMTCAESLSLKFQNRWIGQLEKPRVQRRDFQRFIAHGSMPAVFATRNLAERRSYWQSLIESYVYRDLLLALPKNPKPALAMSALKAIAEILILGELPTFSRILKKVGGSRTVLEKHLIGMEDMMILHRIKHLNSTSAKDILMPFDSAFFLTLLKLDTPLHDVATHVACMHIALINEALAHAQASDLSTELEYAASPTGDLVHLITRNKKNHRVFWKISEQPVPHDYDQRFLDSLISKYSSQGRILSSTERPFKTRNIHVVPWETVL